MDVDEPDHIDHDTTDDHMIMNAMDEQSHHVIDHQRHHTPEPDNIDVVNAHDEEIDPVDFDEDHFSDDSLSDDDSAAMREEHHDASEEDFKDDYNNEQNDDLISNITLGPLHNTTQAVAQLAEGRMSPPEVAMLLYSLQQQQMMQMHLIQQLQSHLAARGHPPAQFPSSLLALPSLPLLPAITSAPDTTSVTSPSILTSSDSRPYPYTTTTSSIGDYTTTTSSSANKPTFRSHLAELETMTNKPQEEEEKAKSGKPGGPGQKNLLVLC